MKLLCLAAVAFGSAAAAMVSWSVPVRKPEAAETAGTRDVSVVDALPPSGGPDPQLPAMSLLLAAGILAYAVLRRWRRV